MIRTRTTLAALATLALAMGFMRPEAPRAEAPATMAEWSYATNGMDLWIDATGLRTEEAVSEDLDTCGIDCWLTPSGH